MVQGLIDPQAKKPGPMPDGEQNLCLSLGHRYCTVYDNISFIDKKASDILCQSTQGGSYETRTLYTNMDLTCVSFRSTLILNGILPSIVFSPDLKDRCLQLTASVTDEKRLTNPNLIALLAQRRPAIMGQIFTVMQQAMAIKDTETTEYKTRMQDFVSWGYPFAKILWGDGNILIDDYQSNKGDLVTSSLLEDPTGVGQAIVCYLQAIPSERFPYVKYSQVLYEEISETAKNQLNTNIQCHPWPQSASKFSDKLRILERSLATFGIRFVKNNGKTQSSASSVRIRHTASRPC